MRSPQLQRALWWVMIALSLAGVAFAWPMTAEAQNPFLTVPVATAAVVGGVLAWRRPENPVGWVFLAVGAVAGVLVTSVVLTAWAADASGPIPWWGVVAAWFSSWIWYPLLYLLTTPILLLFPSGLLSPRWRIALWLPLAALFGAVTMAASAPSLAVEYDSSGTVLREVANPFSPGFLAGIGHPEDSRLFGLFMLVFVGGWIAAIASVGIRFKRATGVERVQMRWFGFAVSMFVPLVVLEILFGDEDGVLWILVLEAVVLSGIPLACGVAILRYRLYDIDRIVSRTTSYAIVTGFLLVGYALVVTTVSLVLPDSSTLAVAAATLCVAAAFRPLLRRVRRTVDRRFDREHYDAEIAVGGFADRLRGANQVASVADDLGAVVQQVFQPSTAAVWVRLPVEPDVGRHGH